MFMNQIVIIIVFYFPVYPEISSSYKEYTERCYDLRKLLKSLKENFKLPSL